MNSTETGGATAHGGAGDFAVVADGVDKAYRMGDVEVLALSGVDLRVGLIRFRGQFDYAACLSVNCLSNSAGHTIPMAE